MRAWVLAVAAGCSFHPSGEALSGTPDASPPGDAGGAWSAWSTRIPLTIANGSDTALPAGYQVGLALDLGAACASGSDHRDVRIADGTTEIARVIDSVGPPQWTWFALTVELAAGATSSGEYWLYCNNPAAPAVADQGSAVFDFYDPFDTLDATRWTVSRAASVGSGFLLCESMSPGENGVYTTATFTAAQHAVDYAMMMQSGIAYWWGGFQTGAVDSPPWLVWLQPEDGDVSPTYADIDEDTWTGNAFAQDTALHIYSVEQGSATMSFAYDDTLFQTHAYAPQGPPAATSGVKLWNDSDNTDEDISFDWVRVRQAVTPAPTVTAGSAEP